MPTVVLASAVARWLTPVPAAVGERRRTLPGGSVRDVLDALFAEHPHLRGYLVDDRGELRHHVVAFVNGVAADKQALDAAIPPDAEVYLFQALSGG
jgi:hypothetical protein